jgi:hypothetical protein
MVIDSLQHVHKLPVLNKKNETPRRSHIWARQESFQQTGKMITREFGHISTIPVVGISKHGPA